MLDDQKLYSSLKAQFRPREGCEEIVEIGGYQVLKLDPDRVEERGGHRFRNLVCFEGDKLLWVAEFPGGNDPNWPGFNVVTGVRASPRAADKVVVFTWGGGVYDVDIATGQYEFVGWTR